MVLFKFGVPILSILGLGYGAYEVFSGKDDPEKMGLAPNILKLFGVANLFMTVCWAIVCVALIMGAGWHKSLALFTTGMFFFDNIVSLAIYKNVGDSSFKYSAGVFLILQIAYCIWL